MMLKAISDRIIIKPEKNEQSKILFNRQNEFVNSGIVISTGDKVKDVDIGDKILFHRFDELPLPDDGLMVIRQKSLLGIYEKKKE